MKDENIASFIGGNPLWIQEDTNPDGYDWKMQIYGPDIDMALAENAGIISGGFLHVFLDRNADFEKEGAIGKTYLELG